MPATGFCFLNRQNTILTLNHLNPHLARTTIKSPSLTRLDDIQKGGAHGGLSGLERVKDILAEVLLQQRVAILGILQTLEASVQLIQGGLVGHFEMARDSGKRNTKQSKG